MTLQQHISHVHGNADVVVSITQQCARIFYVRLSPARLVGVAAGFMLAASASAAVPANAPADVASALNALPQVEMVHTARDGMPTLVRGNLGRAPQLDARDLAGTQRAMRSALAPALGALRVQAADMRLRKISVDAHGNQVLRYSQTHSGLDVIGGDLVVQVDGKGKIFLMNGTLRGDIPATLGRRDVGESAVHPLVVAEHRYAGMATTAPRKVYFVSPEDGVVSLAYETVVTGVRGEDPVRDKVYINAETGVVLSVHPQIHFTENRRIHSANNTTLIPGTLKRVEGGITSTDADVNAAYAGTGAAYEAYKKFWNRDSYDNAGAAMISSVHYSSNYCNAFWNGTQMVFGDGNASSTCKPLARAQDVTAHELTHAVTERESGLVYYGESGGLNEAMSDIFGAFTEAFVLGGKTGTLVVNADTWKIGEQVLTPALRYMNDPAADGMSLDFYSSNAGNRDVHYSSGIANLAFYLLSEGGKHPRGKSMIGVLGVGMDKAIRIFYEANVNLLTSNANFLSAANATVQAAVNLGYSSTEQASVADAWRAVGVTGVTGPTNCSTCPRGNYDNVALENGVAVVGLSGGAASQKFFKLQVPAGQASLSFTIAGITGSTGDVDMYTQFNARPTSSTYACRPYLSGSAETCTIASPAAGTYYVMLSGYTAYSGVTLTGKYTGSGGIGAAQVLSNGAELTGVSGAPGSEQYWMISVPAGKTLTVATSRGTGDADLYVRAAEKPTTTAYACRPYVQGNETCTLSVSTSGDYYIMVRGYTAFSGITLRVGY